MDMKKQLQRRLVANVLMDKCASREHLIFKDSLCSQERVIRFTTHFFRNQFPITDITSGKWKTGDHVMYEVENGVDSCVVNCIYAPIGAGAFPKGILKSWDISNADPNALFNAFDDLLDKTIPRFEQNFAKEQNANANFLEGEEESALSKKYERNRKAREACLAYYGYVCKVCGMDFESTYGENFKEVIEVHHIKPISEIGEKYVVDPINDLVPVCPNCHVALHSKKNGVYGIEELKREIKL